MNKNTYQLHIGSTKKNESFNNQRVIDFTHRKRKNLGENVDITRTKWNYYRDSNPDCIEKFEDFYQEDREKYNSFQQQNNRKKDKWYQEYQKKELLREICFTIKSFGEVDISKKENRENIIEIYKNCIEEFFKILDKEDKKLKTVVIDFVIHFDQTTPHCHVIFSRYKDTEKTLKNGKKLQYRCPSGTSIERVVLQQLLEDFGNYMEENGYDKNQKTSKPHLPLHLYKEFMSLQQEELEKIKEHATTNVKALLDRLQGVVDNHQQLEDDIIDVINSILADAKSKCSISKESVEENYQEWADKQIAKFNNTKQQLLEEIKQLKQEKEYYGK